MTANGVMLHLSACDEGKPAEQYPSHVGKDPNKVPCDCPRGRGHDPEREYGVGDGMPCSTGCNILFARLRNPLLIRGFAAVYSS